MAIELVNIGTFANDGTGDDFREAFDKINRNLEELDLRVGDKTEGVNTGPGTGIFKGKDGFDLQFKSLVEGDNVTITNNNDTIAISSSDSINNLPVISDSGSIIIEPQTVLRVNGGSNISTTVDVVNNSLIVNYDGVSSLSEDNNPTLSSALDADFQNINNVNEITSVNFIGHLSGSMSGTVNGVSDTKFQSFFTNLDFGNINQNITSFVDYLILTVDIDLGTFDNPYEYNIDFGSF
jgi:hypothetical protein